ncbi:MAG: hypothetical protein P8Y44_09675 [Acidobacteriota bacterium]
MPRPTSKSSLAAVVVISVLGVTTHSWSEEPYTPDGTQPPLQYEIERPGSCKNCHGGYDGANHIEPWDTWAGSMMANAARDPIFWAALDVANADGEAMGFEGVGEFCLRCHVPKGWTEQRASADTSVVPPEIGDADGCALGPHPLGIDDPDSDFSGLTCHFCHRMIVNASPPPGEQSFYEENASYWIDDEDCPGQPGNQPCRHGPYDYQGAGEQEAPHVWAHSNYLVDNTICGNCHNVTNPLLNLVDSSGVDQGVGFPIERTFKEWQQSDFSDSQSISFANCSSCHMPDADQGPVYASSFELNDRTGDLPIHQFVGGNTWIPQVLKGEYGASLNRDASFDASTAWAFDMLQNRSALVEITASETVVEDGSLEAEVKVTNLSGHKLPTGYGEGRRMWIHVAVKDSEDVTIWESGAWSSATGDLSEDPQLKVYEVQQGIPPLGFSGGSDPETRPVNYDYPEAAPGVLVNYDVTQYQIPVPEGTPGPVTVAATLYYQTASKEYVEFLRDQAVERGFADDCVERANPLPPGMSRGEYLYALWSDANGTKYGKSPPVDMGTAEGVTEVLPQLLFEDGFE